MVSCDRRTSLTDKSSAPVGGMSSAVISENATCTEGGSGGGGGGDGRYGTMSTAGTASTICVSRQDRRRKSPVRVKFHCKSRQPSLAPIKDPWETQALGCSSAQQASDGNVV